MKAPLRVSAANLHVGGGVTSAATAINAIVALLRERIPHAIELIDFVVSTEVAREVLPETWEYSQVRVHDDLPRNSLGHGMTGLEKRLILRGPEYRRREARIEICGFADATTLPPRNEKSYPTGGTISTPTKSWIKRRVLQRYDQYVVQTESAARRLAGLVGARQIHVIPNSIHTAFFRPYSWREPQLPPRLDEEVRLFYPAVGYPHKNHAMIHEVGQELARRGVKLTVVTTLTADSPVLARYQSSPHFINIGKQPTSALPRLYQETDGLFFPSRLETFSSAPIEAAYMHRPVIASDLWFVRETVEDYPEYFDPFRTESAADAIQRCLHSVSTRVGQWSRGSAIAARYSPPKVAEAYIGVLLGLDLGGPT